MAAQHTTQQERHGSRWLTNWLYGMDCFPSNDHVMSLLKAVFICAAGDGKISDEERNFAFGYLDAVGVPDSMHDFIKNYQGKEDKLEDLINNKDAINEQTKRCIIYTAIIVAGADGYDDKEHEVVVKMAGRLGVDGAIVNQIRDQYQTDMKEREKRINLLFPGEHPWAKKK